MLSWLVGRDCEVFVGVDALAWIGEPDQLELGRCSLRLGEFLPRMGMNAFT